MYTSMETAVVEHFQRKNEIAGRSVILSCRNISKATGLKSRRVFLLLHKSPRFTRVEGDMLGYWGERYNFFSLVSSQ